MRLRIARKVGERFSGHLDDRAYNPETLRRAARRLQKSGWRRQSLGDWPWDDDTRRASSLAKREYRRRRYNALYVDEAAGWVEPRDGRWGSWNPWPPDGIRIDLALRGLPWLPAWEAARSQP